MHSCTPPLIVENVVGVSTLPDRSPSSSSSILYLPPQTLNPKLGPHHHPPPSPTCLLLTPLPLSLGVPQAQEIIDARALGVYTVEGSYTVHGAYAVVHQAREQARGMLQNAWRCHLARKKALAAYPERMEVMARRLQEAWALRAARLELREMGFVGRGRPIGVFGCEAGAGGGEYGGDSFEVEGSREVSKGGGEYGEDSFDLEEGDSEGAGKERSAGGGYEDESFAEDVSGAGTGTGAGARGVSGTLLGGGGVSSSESSSDDDDGDDSGADAGGARRRFKVPVPPSMPRPGRATQADDSNDSDDSSRS
jgi:hypothetical protein